MKLLSRNLRASIIPVLICAAIGIYFRLYPLRNFEPDDTNERATIYVIGQLRQKVTEKVKASHPGLPATQQESLIRDFLSEIMRDEKDRVRATIRQVSGRLSGSRGSQNYPYLLASDSFYYYDLTRRLVETGRYSASFKGSKYFHELMLAPLGHWEPVTWHPYVGLAIYNTLKFFNQEIPLMYAVSWTPLAVSTLALISFFLAGLSLGCRVLALLPAGIFLTLAPIFIKRSVFGWYDNDPYNIFFPLLILAVIFQAMAKPRPEKSAVIYGLILGALMGVYAHLWQGWVFFFGVLSAALIIRIIYARFNPPKNFLTGRPFLFMALTFWGATFLIIGLAFGPKEFFILFREGWAALQNFLEPQLNNWPDLYMSVGELRSASWDDIIRLSGGPVFFGVSLGGLGVSLWRALNNKNYAGMTPRLIVLATFLGLSLFIAKGAQRFIILCLPPLALSFALGAHWGLTAVEKLAARFLRPEQKARRAALILSGVMAALTASIPVKNISEQLPKILTPIYNSTWDRALLFLKDNTPEDSVINTWWPPGHFIKSTARRAVTFDGASINYPQSYWISNALLQNDENMTLGIIRMLNNSGHRAADFLESRGFSTLDSVALLREVVRRDGLPARIILSSTLKNQPDAEHVLAMTHTRPPPSYIFLYNEFIDNNLQLRFFGNWNFPKIAEINADPGKLAKIPRRNSPAYIDFLWDLAGGPSRYSGVLDEAGRRDSLVIFQHNLTVDLQTKACFIKSGQYGQGVPFSIFFLKDGQVKEKIMEGGDKSYSVVLIENQGRYQAVLMDRFLAASALMQMYFFDAKSLDHIDLIYQDADLTGRTKIKIFRIDWPAWEKSLKTK
jgi:dolichyl-diphosphooligosaccharide--protein glycosyltransferase